ncbi:MAG: 1-acyl-sn-glycerol-3-phosphate acyltransferase, partial [Desulfosudaceae bacterium]
MNRYAYRTTGLALRILSALIRPSINIHDRHHIPPDNPVIFVINHFTRAETILLPYYLDKLTSRTIWSLADHNLFKGGLGAFMEKVGALSTAAPDRDQLIVKSLLTNEAAWIIFPEGRMVKNKKIFEVVNEQKRFLISTSAGKHPPHTGAATLALRTEFYRERLKKMAAIYPDEARRLLDLFGINTIGEVVDKSTCLVPVNITYYPIRAKENNLSSLAQGMFDNLSAKAIEELQAESTMLMSDTDIDIRFGEPIPMARFMTPAVIRENIELKAQIGFNDSIVAKKMLRATAVRIMERYMASIYSMTTVNHDHLFASILKHLPADRIDEDDFRRRVFLSLTELSSLKPGIFRHTSCSQSQVRLLTDDRHGKYANFMDIAEETGIVQQEGRVLIRNSDMFVQPDSLQTRVENPVVIIANEVEPLAELQAIIRRLSLESPENIRQQVARYLIQQADFRFEKDYANHAVKGESKKKNIGRPYLLRGQTGRPGLILIHGYMAAPLEVKALARHLNRQGYTVY